MLSLKSNPIKLQLSQKRKRKFRLLHWSLDSLIIKLLNNSWFKWGNSYLDFLKSWKLKTIKLSCELENIKTVHILELIQKTMFSFITKVEYTSEDGNNFWMEKEKNQEMDCNIMLANSFIKGIFNKGKEVVQVFSKS